MTWEPPGLLASTLISILGGLAAGPLVLVVEAVIRRGIDRQQRKKAERAIGQFFGKWEKAINEATDGPERYFDGMPVHFYFHRAFLRLAPDSIAAWSRYLTAEQVDKLSGLIQQHGFFMTVLYSRPCE